MIARYTPALRSTRLAHFPMLTIPPARKGRRNAHRRPGEGLWTRLIRLMAVLMAAVLALAWWNHWERQQAERNIILDNARQAQQTIARIIAENLSQVLEQGDRLAVAARQVYDRDPLKGLQRLDSMRSSSPLFPRMVLLDTNARVLHATSPMAATTLFEPELHRLTESTFTGPMAVATPARAGTTSNALVLPLLYAVRSEGGQLLGAMMLDLDLGYLLGLYFDLALGPTTQVQVVAGAGQVLVDAGASGLLQNNSLSQPTLLPPSQTHGSRYDTTLRPGEVVQSTWQKLASDDFWVVVHRDLNDILGAMPGASRWNLAILALLTLMLTGLSAWIFQASREQRDLVSSLQRVADENHELINRLETEKQKAFTMAAHDHLTGLHNRRMFNELAASHLQQARRGSRQYALLYLDLDRFKNINDSLGHHVGDLLLKTTAQRMRHTVRSTDVIGRMGGDEFAILLTDLERAEDAEHVAAKLVAALVEPCRDLDGHDLQVGTSIGIAVFPRDGDTIETLCRHADAAMYEAKRSGRGGHKFYDPALNRAGDWQFNLEQRLPRAIQHDELILHFQPKVQLTDFRVVGFEALVRWDHPEHGLIYPKDFIPLAEDTGMILELGAWVIEACARQLVQWRNAGLPMVPIAFNVSSRQLRDEHLPELIAATLQRHDLEGCWLEVEITETGLVESTERASEALSAIASQGLRISLDDFGNGFCNLSYIRTLPIHQLKIDRSFVSDVRNRHDDAVIVESIITLAHNLELGVVAEGVETADQIVHLKTAGCDQVQGYFVSRPVPAEKATSQLRQTWLHPR